MVRASIVFFLVPGCFSWFSGILGTEVNNNRGGSWRRYFTTLLYLAAKHAHVGVDMDGLTCPLHHPLAYGRQTSGQGLQLGVVLSHYCSRVVVHFRGM
jgi:hypothetical protein